MVTFLYGFQLAYIVHDTIINLATVRTSYANNLSFFSCEHFVIVIVTALSLRGYESHNFWQ